MPRLITDDLFIQPHPYNTCRKHKNKPIHVISKLTLVFFLILASNNNLSAQNIGYYNPDQSAKFFFNAGIGYGVANNPVKIPGESGMRGGITVGAALGYRFSEKFSLGFGPSFWFEGRDVTDNSASNNEHPSNKRTLVTLDGYYKPFQKLPLQFRLGAGIGTFVYTPNKNVVSSDNNGISKTEITSGFASSAGLIYKMNLGEKISLFPSLNFGYGRLEPQKIQYETIIDHKKASIITDIRINAFVFF